MNTYKIEWREYMNSSKTGNNLIKAESLDKAQTEFEQAYPINVIVKITNCSTPEYQSAFDAERFDANGRRRF